MRSVQIASVEEPFVSPEAMDLALRLVAKAETMGLLPSGASTGPVALDRPLIDGIATEMARVGVGVTPATVLKNSSDADVVVPLRAVIDALSHSPRPEGEWGPVREILDDNLLTELLGGLSVSSLRRYAEGERRTPEDVAWRLHVVSTVISSLAGSYNDYGITRWFRRGRTPLSGQSPSEVIRQARSEDDERVKVVLRLAEDLLGAGSGT